MGVDITSTLIPDFDYLKIVKVGKTLASNVTVTTGSATWGTNFVIDTIPHNLGFVPIPMGFITVGSTFFPIPITVTGTGVGLVNFYASTVVMYTDATNLYIRTEVSVNTSAATSFTITNDIVRYYLFRDPAK